jgi:subtilisin family serine protease
MTGHPIPRPGRLGAIALAALALSAISAPHASAAARVDASVAQALRAAAADQKLDVIVVLRRQAVLPDGPLVRRRAIIEALRGLADSEQRRLVALLVIRRLQGRVSKIRRFWIINGLEVVADPDVVTEIAALPEVAEIKPNATVQAPSAPASSLAPEWNIARVKAPDLWGLGYRGQGVVVANMDTGVDVSHPDLNGRWRGGTNSWYDPNGEHPTTPTDVSGHGTWTMGTMVGGDAGGSAIGMAPDARWIAVKIFNDHGAATTAGVHAGFQWLLDPDGNPATDDAPDVVDDSWTTAAGCDLTFEPDLGALRSSAIVPVFAAGNSGPTGGTSMSPATDPSALAVGGTDPGELIDPESSRGPSACTGTAFPQLVAPGVNVRTSDLFGGYMSLTGTSIAAPHAAGALALLLSAFPGLDQQRQTNSLLSGALDLGDPGPDNVFGSGRLDALASYQWLAGAPDFSLVVTPSAATTTAGGSVTYSIDVQPLNGFAGDVTLSLSGLSASQASWSFSPATVPGGAAHTDLTVTTATSLAPGTYALKIKGASGTNTRSARVALVIPQPPDFSLAVTPASRSTAPGAGVAYTVSTTTTGGFTGDVALSLSGLTAGQATWNFTPSATITGGAGASTLTVSTASALAPGRYTLTITATSGSLTHSATVTLVVPDFSLGVSPTSRTTTPGTAVTYAVSVGAVNGFTGTVALSLSGLSQGTWSFTPASVTGSGTSTLRVTPTAAGTYTLTVTGTSGPITHTRTVTLIVSSPADFGLSATPASRSVNVGGSTTYSVTVLPVGGFAGSVSLSVSGLPSGATASFSPTSATPSAPATLTVRTTRTTPRGTRTLTITGRSGTLTHTANVTLVVT